MQGPGQRNEINYLTFKKIFGIIFIQGKGTYSNLMNNIKRRFESDIFSQILKIRQEVRQCFMCLVICPRGAIGGAADL